MGCSNCGTGGCSSGGCQSNGTCSSGGCNKLGVFDWLANMTLPQGMKPFDIAEIRFKNGRKSFYKNTKNLSLNVGDIVVVEASPGFDVGVVSIVGELARIQVNKKSGNKENTETPQIYRIANQDDVQKFNHLDWIICFAVWPFLWIAQRVFPYRTKKKPTPRLGHATPHQPLALYRRCGGQQEYKPC